MYSGNPPFPDIKRDVALLLEVVYRKRKPPCPEDLAEKALWDVVKACLEYDSMTRPAASEIRVMLANLISPKLKL